MKMPSTAAAVTSVQAGSFGVAGLVPKSQSKNAKYNLTCHKNLFFVLPLGVKCEECCRGTATSLCNKCETVYCSACFERVCTV